MLYRPELEEWLSENGYSSKRIKRVLERVAEFDEQISRDALFDDIECGEFSLAEALE
jgi:hypothetical protein